MPLSYLYRQVADSDEVYSRDATSNSGHGASASSSSILLISFNMASAALLIATILFDAWRLSRKNGSAQAEKRYRFLHSIRPGEVATLSISIAVLLQGLVFVVIQSVEMGSSVSSNCSILGEILFPALWLVGFVILVFGMETLYRGFQRIRFAPPKRGSVYICWAAVLFLTLMTWIPTQVRHSTLHTCSFGLLAGATPWSGVAFGASITLIVSYTLIASMLTIQLFRTADISPMGRIAASQMVYYLAIGTIVFTLFLPFWTKSILGIPKGVTPMMAMMSINMIGIVLSFFQLLFRSYTDSMTIRYSDSFGALRDWKFLGCMRTEIKRKISAPITIQEDESSFLESTHSATTPGSVNTMNIYKSLPPTPTLMPTPAINEQPKQKDDSYKSKGYYSIFPAKLGIPRLKYPTSSIYEDDILLVPPRPPFAAAHNRNLSDVSHATVQIGLRLSNLDPPGTPSSSSLRSPGNLCTSQASWARDTMYHMSTTSLDVPVTLRSPAATTGTFQPSRLRSSTLPTPSTNTMSIESSNTQKHSSPSPSPVAHRNLDDLQRLLDVDLKAARQAAAAAAASHNESWPLRDSLPILLPKRTYQADENGQIY